MPISLNLYGQTDSEQETKKKGMRPPDPPHSVVASLNVREQETTDNKIERCLCAVGRPEDVLVKAEQRGGEICQTPVAAGGRSPNGELCARLQTGLHLPPPAFLFPTERAIDLRLRGERRTPPSALPLFPFADLSRSGPPGTVRRFVCERPFSGPTRVDSVRVSSHVGSNFRESLHPAFAWTLSVVGTHNTLLSVKSADGVPTTDNVHADEGCRLSLKMLPTWEAKHWHPLSSQHGPLRKAPHFQLTLAEACVF
ncbi:hypothetical protein AAG570_012865 [Ranatra chinensis]|uniref:Uncharacterized protein n=1 Tax=Ranatra chinensis TaxID=642074 RepID=A0ABD0YFE0_9HEMI